MTPADLEKICTALPGTKQDVKWGHDLCYTVAEKMYCVTGLDGPFTVSMKVLPEEMVLLTERDGIIPAPYMAKNNWVFVENPKALTVKEWKHYVSQSYDLVVAKLPKKVQEKLKSGGSGSQEPESRSQKPGARSKK